MVQLEAKTYEELLQIRDELAQVQEAQADKITPLEAEVAWYREQWKIRSILGSGTNLMMSACLLKVTFYAWKRPRSGRFRCYSNAKRRP